jgi:hypothetical protein
MCRSSVISSYDLKRLFDDSPNSTHTLFLPNPSQSKKEMASHHYFRRTEFGRSVFNNSSPILRGTICVLNSSLLRFYCLEPTAFIAELLVQLALVAAPDPPRLTELSLPLDFLMTSRILKLFSRCFNSFHLFRFRSFYLSITSASLDSRLLDSTFLSSALTSMLACLPKVDSFNTGTSVRMSWLLLIS